MMGRSDGEPGGGLPAPYESPWRRLGGDLRAVAADLGLRLRALFRLNREGGLPLQGPVPAALRPWLWPLLLALPLLALVLMLVLVRPLSKTAAPPSPAPAASTATTAPRQGERTQSLETAALPLPLEPATSQAASAEQQALPATMPTQAPEMAPEAGEPSLEEQLLEALTTGSEQAWLQGAHPDSDGGGLTLITTKAYRALASSARQHQADQWLERSRELGYGQLELLDAEGRPLGRSALVGSGMILAPAPADG